MQGKGLLGLLLATIAAVAVAGFATLGGSGPAADPLAGELVLPEVAPRLADIGRLALVHDDEKTTLLRRGDGWVIEEKGGYPADSAKIRQALLGLAELTYVEPKTQKPDLYSRLEVEDAGNKDSKSTMVTLADVKGSLIGEVITGKHRADQLGGGEDGIYIRKPGNARSWLARGKLDLAGETTQWLDDKLLDLPVAQVKEADFTAPDGKKLTILRDKPSDKFKLAELPKDKKLKSDDALDDPAGALANTELADVQPAKDFDFPADGVGAAKFTSFDGLTVTVALADKDGKSWARFQVAGTGDAEKQAAELNAKLQPWVFGLAEYKLKALRTRLDDLIETPKPS
jgi:hypothetical protein